MQVAEIDIMIEAGANLSAKSVFRGNEGRIELPPNSTQGLVVVTWEPTAPTAQRLTIQVLDGPFLQDGVVIMEAEGESPLAITVPAVARGYWHFIAKPAEFQVTIDQPVHVRAEIESLLGSTTEPTT